MLRRHIVTIALGVLGCCMPVAAKAEISFMQPPPLILLERPQALAVADFNKDGIDDVVVVSSVDVTIVLVDASGNFFQATTERVGTELNSIASGEFNNDSNRNPDVVLGSGTKKAHLVFGAGNGTFSGSREISRCCAAAGVAAVDLDQANGDDLVFSNPGTDEVSVFTNRGEGNQALFNNEQRFDAGQRPEALVAADFNQDGFPDVAVLNTGAGGRGVTVYLTGTRGTLTAVANFVTTGTASMMTAGDLNGDGLPDIVAGDKRDNMVGLLLNRGAGFLGIPTILSFRCPGGIFGLENCELRDVAVADFDGDGILDIAAALAFFGTSTTPDVPLDAIDVAAGLGNEVFQVPMRFSGVSKGIRAMALGHFNDDGKTDIAFISQADRSVRLLLNDSSAPPPRPTVTRVVGTATPTLPSGVATRTPTIPAAQLTCDTSRGDADCIAPRPPFCSLTGPGTQGICCDTPCSGANERCDLPGREGTCLPTSLPNGEPCGANGQCVANVCAQGYCCDRACNGANERCDTPGAVGTCVAVATPTPTLPGGVTASRTATPTAVPGSNGSDCSSAAQCVSGICEDDVCCASVCAGNQRCDLDGGRGRCLGPDVPNGDVCEAPGQCQSGNCPPDDGVCCNSPCDGPNQRCDLAGVPPGLCLEGDLPNGSACVFRSQCQSNNCPAASVCCSTPCDQPNERCDVQGSVGICVVVTPGQATRTPTATPMTPGQATRTPTATPTRTLPGGNVTIARGSGCGISPADQGGGLLMLLLVVPLWWWGGRVPLIAKGRSRYRSRLPRE